jgi:predicted transcriptional regulator
MMPHSGNDQTTGDAMSSERQMKILHQLTRHGSLEVNTLSDLLQVSPSTIRRDLTALERGCRFFPAPPLGGCAYLS